MSSPIPPVIDDFIRACNGAIASVVSTAILLPLDVCKAKLYADSKQHAKPQKLPTNIWAFAVHVYKSEGLAGLYSGGHIRLLEQLTTKFTFYYFYSFFTHFFKARLVKGSGDIGAFLNLFVGYLAAVANTFLTLPVQVVSAIMMVESSHSSASRGALKVASNIVNESGYKGLYRGVLPSVILSINPAVEFMVFEQLKLRAIRAYGLRAHDALSMGAAFWFGVIAKAIATLITFPYIRIKVLLQVGRGSAKKKSEAHKVSSSDVFFSILKDDGFLGLWRGVEAQLSKALLSSGLKFSIDESVKKVVRDFLLSVLRSS